MPTFKDSENIPALLPEGDYTFCVVGFDIGISSGGKTNGSDKYTAELEIEPSGKIVKEILVDHESIAWKIDCFLKSCGVALAKGESFEFREDKAMAAKVKWVNPIGLRGHCALFVDEYLKGTEKRKANKVAAFHTNKGKLTPRVIAPKEEDMPF